MCGRFTIAVPPEELRELLEVDEIPNVAPRYNAAPSQMLLAGRMNAQRKREAVLLKWGLLPSWANDPKIAYSLINARSETLATKPSFRSAFKNRRCVIPADGFIEWLADGKKKRPHRFRRPDRCAFLFAGLWEHRERPNEPTVESCTIVTTSANSCVRPFHERMPVILAAEHVERWLQPVPLDPELAATMLVPAPDKYLMVEEISPIINSPRVDSPECIQVLASE